VPPRESTGNWENIFSWAQTAAQQAYGFAQTVGNTIAGRHLARSSVKGSVRVSRTNHVLISLRMPMETYEAAVTLNVLQLRAFRETLHELLDEELDAIFTSDTD
jgi:hypothetical protein